MLSVGSNTSQPSAICNVFSHALCPKVVSFLSLKEVANLQVTNSANRSNITIAYYIYRGALIDSWAKKEMKEEIKRKLYNSSFLGSSIARTELVNSTDFIYKAVVRVNSNRGKRYPPIDQSNAYYKDKDLQIVQALLNKECPELVIDYFEDLHQTTLKTPDKIFSSSERCDQSLRRRWSSCFRGK